MGFQKILLLILSFFFISKTLAGNKFTPIVSKQKNYCEFLSINKKMNPDVCFENYSRKIEKMLIALYQLQRYYEKDNMEDYCSKKSEYGEYIEVMQKEGRTKKFYYEEILPFIKQREYLCTQYESGEYCDPESIKFDFDDLNLRVDSICGSNTWDVCDKAFIDLALTLRMQSADDYDDYDITVSCDDQLETLLFCKVNHMRDDLDRKINMVCSKNPIIIKTKRVIDETKPAKSLSICGNNIGSCSDNQCCSRNGWCGNSKDYCKIEIGCQSEFGRCDEPYEDPTDPGTELPISTNDKCGEEDGICPSNKCCSKYGWCGRTSEYCDIQKGCQLKYGRCNGTTELPISTNDRCGEKYGICPSNKCCSKYGWCGRSSDYCKIEKGCQLKFGNCEIIYEIPTDPDIKLPISTNDKCGEEDGICSSNKCCSKYGWCGNTSDYCSISKGCQSKFGKCN